jgi:hypothetical protein
MALVCALWVITLDGSRDLQQVSSTFYEKSLVWPTERFIFLLGRFRSGNTRSIKKSSGTCHVLARFNSHSLRSSFQQAVVRSVNDKNAQLQRQLENVVREGACVSHSSSPFMSLTEHLDWHTLP